MLNVSPEILTSNSHCLLLEQMVAHEWSLSERLPGLLRNIAMEFRQVAIPEPPNMIGITSGRGLV